MSPVSIPKTQYARSGDVHIAYQVLGKGPDLVFVPGWVSYVEQLARFRVPENVVCP